MAITSATLLVTTLLVASPILFLISTAPSPLPRDCYMEGDGCSPTASSTSECTEDICETVSSNIQARLNWNKDPCSEFKKFSCWRRKFNKNYTNIIEMGNSQKSVDIQMQSKLNIFLLMYYIYNCAIYTYTYFFSAYGKFKYK